MTTKTGRAAVLEEFGGAFALREFPVPDPEPGALVVKVDVATVCGSDVHIWQNDLGATYTLPLPLILGHEMVGTVVAVGAGSERDSLGEDVRVGDRIVWANGPCGHCPTCTIDKQLTLCPDRVMVPLIDCSVPPHFAGAFAEYAYVSPLQGRLRVQDALRSEWASAASCALRTVINTVEAAGRVDFLESVVVQGAGPLGLFATAILSTLGPKHLIVVGAPAERLRLAEEWGATHTVSIEDHPTPEARRAAIHAITGRGGPSIALELSGARGAVGEGIGMLRAYGRYVITGTIGGGLQSIDVSRITTRGLRVTGSMSGDIDAYAKALAFLDAHRDRFDWDRMLGQRFGLDQVADALGAIRGMTDIKPIVDPTLALA